jgi:hypothetical protein
MPELNPQPRYNVGDKVRVTSGARLVGTVTEVRGAGPPPRSGRICYRVYVPMDPEPLMLEVRDEEIEKA